MKQKRYFLLCVTTCISLLLPSPAFAATENDLREVMGLGRTDSTEDAKAQARAIIASCITDQNYNELADQLSDYKLNDFSDEITIVKDGTEAYNDILSNFKAGKSYQTVLSNLSAYETYYSNKEELSKVTIPATIEKIDEAEIASRLAYANALLNSISDTTDIGQVGKNSPLFTGDEMLYIDALDATTLTVKVVSDKTIYAPFTGTVTKTTKNSITIESGATIVATLTGIKPSVKNKQIVTQNDEIGVSTGSVIAYTLSVCSKDQNPLLSFGDRAVVWYDRYVTETGEDILSEKMSQIKDTQTTTDTSTSEEDTSVGSVTTEDGTVMPVIIDSTPETDISNIGTNPDNVIQSDPFQGDVSHEH